MRAENGTTSRLGGRGHTRRTTPVCYRMSTSRVRPRRIKGRVCQTAASCTTDDLAVGEVASRRRARTGPALRGSRRAGRPTCSADRSSTGMGGARGGKVSFPPREAPPAGASKRVQRDAASRDQRFRRRRGGRAVAVDEWSQQDLVDRPEQDDHVQGQRPVLDIEQVEALIGLERGIVTGFDLPQAGDAGAHLVAGVQLGRELGDLGSQRRPRADQAHVAAAAR